MLIRPAKDVRAHCNGDLSCPHPGCPVRFAPTGRHRPVLTDNNGRPFCSNHAGLASPPFGDFQHNYELSREQVAKMVDAGLMTDQDAKQFYLAWDGPALDAKDLDP